MTGWELAETTVLEPERTVRIVAESPTGTTKIRMVFDHGPVGLWYTPTTEELETVLDGNQPEGGHWEVMIGSVAFA